MTAGGSRTGVDLEAGAHVVHIQMIEANATGGVGKFDYFKFGVPLNPLMLQVR